MTKKKLSNNDIRYDSVRYADINIPGIESRAFLEFITPEKAQTMLTTTINNNRKIRKNKVEVGARDMLTGGWRINGETIKINEKNQLFDGQHRLSMALLAKETDPSFEGFWSWVVRGVSDESKHTVDVGAKRMPADILTISNARMADQNVRAAIVKIIHLYEKGKLEYIQGGQEATMTPDEIINVYKRHKSSVEKAMEFVSTGEARDFGYRSPVAFCYWLLTSKFGLEGHQFMEGLITGAGLDKDDCRLIFRRSYINKRQGNKANVGISRSAFISALWRTFHDWREGQSKARVNFAKTKRVKMPKGFYA